MQTNIEISSRTIPSLLGYRDALRTIKTYQLKGEDATLSDGGSYQIVTSNHLLEIQNRIRTELGLHKVSQLKTNATVYEKLYGSTKSQTVNNNYDSSGQAPSYSDSHSSYANYSSGVDTGSSYQSASTDQDYTASSHTPTTPSSSSDALAADESSSSGSGSLVPPANINPQT